jgi:hypothetical protein
MAVNPVIVLEFNELTPSLIDRFVGEGVLPNFKKFRDESRVFTTLAEERPPNLEPWIQWVTVHSGLPYSEHGVFHLDEGHKLDAKRTWEVLSERGATVWVCGSMNIRADGGTRGALLPDPWCTKVRPTPSELAPYFRFVQQNVLEHTNQQAPLDRSDQAKFLTFMMRHGLSASTVATIAKQLFDERRNDCRWKRVVLLDLLQFDLFANYFRRLAPALSTFFLNSTAHYQHAYWDSMEPEHFRPTSDVEKQKYRDAIKFGYQKMDVMLGRFLDLASASGATLVLCTALSQQPSPDYDQHDGGVFYRPRNFGEFGKAIGLTGPYSVQPVMSEQFHLEFTDTARAESAAQRLRAVTMESEAVMSVEHSGTRIFTGCRLHGDVAREAVLSSGDVRRPFYDVFYRMDTSKTGVHHPDGLLWIRLADRRHAFHNERVPLTAVAPTILSLCGVSAPQQMSTPPLSMVGGGPSLN